MYTVYVIQDSFGKLYKGFTNNLKRRLREHNAGHTITTSRMKDLKVVYTEEYDSFDKARVRELYLKSAAGRRFLHKAGIEIHKGVQPEPLTAYCIVQPMHLFPTTHSRF